jgi:hypothetical protein
MKNLVVTHRYNSLNGQVAKFSFICTLVGIMLFSFTGISFADEVAGKKHVVTDISSLKDRIATEMKTLLADDIRDHAKMMKDLKAAGASYISALTIPLSSAKVNKDKDIKRILWGMYSIDSAYAAVFGKKKAVSEKIQTAGNMARDLNLSASVFPAMKKLAKKKGKITVDDLTDTLAKEVEVILPQISDKPADVEFWADSAYGGVVQGIFIISEIIALNDYSPEMLELLNSQKEHIEFLEAVELFKPHKKSGKMAIVCERFKGLEPIHQILLQKSTYTKEDCEKVRSIITAIRFQILAGISDGDCR